MNTKLVFKNDRYKKSRGGYSRWLMLSCEKCKNKLFKYQKDGPGIIKRLYLDRINGWELNDKNLECKKCGKILGVYYIYEKENRPAYRLFVGSVAKKIIKGN